MVRGISARARFSVEQPLAAPESMRRKQEVIRRKGEAVLFTPDSIT
jgi:hypothetical protein